MSRESHPTYNDVVTRSEGCSRRDALKLSAGTLAMLGMGSGAALLGGIGGCAHNQHQNHANSAGGPATSSRRTRLLRIAHLTDTHIQPERKAYDGVTACLKHAQSHKPDVIVTGGDLIMDAYEADFDRTRTQWDLWQRVLNDHCSTPVLHTLGNHDIWGWNKSKSKTTGSESQWGKRWACEMVGRDLPWYAADVAGVRIVILDSTQPDPENASGYIAYCDDAQFYWLKSMIESTPATTPVVVVSHIPIVSTTAMLDDKSLIRTDDHRIGRNVMHADATRLVELFRSRGNVRACLSGHMHLLDRVEMHGITYLCNGAVSGGWWSGPNQDVHAGYALVDLFSDGSVERSYITYGWAYQA